MILYDVANGIARITLNRPDKRNALNAELIDAIKNGLAKSARDPECRVAAKDDPGTRQFDPLGSVPQSFGRTVIARL